VKAARKLGKSKQASNQGAGVEKELSLPHFQEIQRIISLNSFVNTLRSSSLKEYLEPSEKSSVWLN